MYYSLLQPPEYLARTFPSLSPHYDTSRVYNYYRLQLSQIDKSPNSTLLFNSSYLNLV